MTAPALSRAFTPDDRLSALAIRGSKLRQEVAEAVIGGPEVSMSTDGSTELTVNLADPGLEIAFAGVITPGALVQYEDLRLVVARIETTGGPAGTGGLTFVARSEVVRNLKRRRGALVMRGRSPSQFVEAECKAVRARAVVQPSATRSSVARDVPEAGQRDEGSDQPSSWTTFRRLAGELGYLLFEIGGVVYFGQPTWLMARLGVVRAGWRNEPEATRTLGVPRCSFSEDSPMEKEVTLTLPHTRAGTVRTGMALDLRGMPAPFTGRYLISEVTTALSGKVPLTVTAVAPRNPAGTGNPGVRFDLTRVVARNGSPKRQEAQFPRTVNGGAHLVHFDGSGQGVALYNDGTVIDGKGTQPVKQKPTPPPASSGSSASGGGGGGTVVTGGTGNLNVFVSKAVAQAGGRYVFGAEANLSDPDPRAFDCSELIEWAAAQAGVRFVDGSSAQIAACERAGLGISVARAKGIRGALLWTPGHIGISLGDGRTIEARNARAGIVIGGSGDIKWKKGGLVPGINYGTVR